MSHFLIADGHFVGAPGEGERMAALLTAAGDISEVSILGDLFELWLGLEGLERPWQAAFFAPLHALKARGVKLRYVVGNKDFFVREWNARHNLFDEIVERDVVFESALGRVRLAHGDLVNRADRQYRLWRAFSRSWPMRWLMRLVPRRFLARQAEKVAERLKRTNQYHKSYFPEAHLLADAKASPAAFHFYGHFHVHRELETPHGRVITLPFLGGEWAGLLLSDRGIERIELGSVSPSQH